MQKKLLLPAILAFSCCHALYLSGQTDLPAITEKGATPLATPSTLPTGQAGVHRPPSTVRAVVVGISDYQDNGIPDLQYAHRDAEAFAAWLRSPAGGSLDGDQLKVLVNQQATHAQFVAELYWLMQESGEGDQVIIYFSGHGSMTRNFAAAQVFDVGSGATRAVVVGISDYPDGSDKPESGSAGAEVYAGAV